MKYGFVRAAAASPKLKVADVKFNAQEILKELKRLAGEKTEIAVFPELSLCGYTCGDLFFDGTLLKSTRAAAFYLAEEANKFAPELLFFVGLPVEKGGKLYNCAAAICGGKILALIPKSALPNYNEFYEKRYFTEAQSGVDLNFVFGAGENACVVPFGTNVLIEDTRAGVSVACEICEDLWISAPPSQNHAAAGAQIIAAP